MSPWEQTEVVRSVTKYISMLDHLAGFLCLILSLMNILNAT